MAEKSDIVRRGLGAFFLIAALGMLVVGESALKERLHSHPLEFLIFWMGCFVLVGLAFLMALLDMVVVRRRVRREERELLASTLEQIQRAKELKAKPPPEKSVN